jgi:hypothetical protein
MRRVFTVLVSLAVAAACFYCSWYYFDRAGRGDFSSLVALSESPDSQSHLAQSWRLENPSGGARSGRIAIVVRSRKGPNTEEERSEYGPRPLESFEADEEFVVGSVAVERDTFAELTIELLNVNAQSERKVKGEPLQLRVELSSGDEAVRLTGEKTKLGGDKYLIVTRSLNHVWQSGEQNLYKVMTATDDQLWIYEVFLRRDE